MKEYGKLKLKMHISYYDVDDVDADNLSDSIESSLSSLGDAEIDEMVAESDIEISATLEIDTVRNYQPASWGYYGGDPGYNEILDNISERDIEKILSFEAQRAHVHFFAEEWEAA